MFNLAGLFSILFAIAAFIVGNVFLTLKIAGVLLLPWGWALAPFYVMVILILVGVAKHS